jgi:hypothetical protein
MSEAPPRFPALSKRAARRLIQRAVVLAGRDRGLHVHLRHEQFTALCRIEDWNFAWSIAARRGRLRFDRRPVKNPELTLTWASAEEFFADVENSSVGAGNLTASVPQLPRVWERIHTVFCASLRQLLANPVDESGDPLL